MLVFMEGQQYYEQEGYRACRVYAGTKEGEAAVKEAVTLPTTGGGLS